MTAFSRFVLFVSSYVPLFGVFALLDSFGKGWPTGISIALTAVGVMVLPVTLVRARKLAPQPLKADTTQVRDGDALAYIATYIVPFAATTATTARERGALGLFVLLIAIIYVRSELFYINPLLALAGYRLFEVVTPSGASVVLVTHRRFLASGSCVMARRLGDYVYWEPKER